MVIFQSSDTASGSPFERPTGDSKPPREPPAARPPAVPVARPGGGRRPLRLRAAQPQEPPVSAGKSLVRRVGWVGLAGKFSRFFVSAPLG